MGSLCNREITSYMQIFSATQGEASHLDKVERRYAYIKQKIKQREDSWAVFPVSWRVPQLITLALCKARRRATFPRVFLEPQIGQVVPNPPQRWDI